MDRPILAMQLKDILIKPQPWDEAQRIWFQKAAKELNKPEILDYTNSPDYFKYVLEVMISRMPKASQDERVKQARKEYFDIVIDYIKHTTDLILKDNLKKILELKQTHKLGLITTNTKDAIHEILNLTNLTEVFDVIAFSNNEEKDDAIEVAKRFMNVYGHPKDFIFRQPDKLVEFLAQEGVRCIKLDHI